MALKIQEVDRGILYQIINQLAHSYQMEHLKDYIHNVENAVVYKVGWFLQRFKNRKLNGFER